MAQQTSPTKSAHVHGSNCGHVRIEHEGHVDYLDGGKLCHQEESGQVTAHVIPLSKQNPAACTPTHNCGQHDKGHVHGPGCGHEAIPHGDHMDYLVAGHLHHPHDGHCDDHGPVAASNA